MVLLVACLLVFAYHYERNGSPWDLGDTACRLTWAIAFSTSYMMLVFLHINWWLVAWFMFAGFIEILVPHAFAQRMGNRTDSWETLTPITVGTFFGKTITIPKWWPALWFEPFLPMSTPLEQDFIGMTSTGLVRGLIVFLPPYCFGVTHSVAIPVCLTMLWQPISYAVGWITPLTLWTNPARSSQWGEFYIGIGWALALAGAVCVS